MSDPTTKPESWDDNRSEAASWFKRKRRLNWIWVLVGVALTPGSVNESWVAMLVFPLAVGVWVSLVLSIQLLEVPSLQSAILANEQEPREEPQTLSALVLTHGIFCFLATLWGSAALIGLSRLF